MPHIADFGSLRLPILHPFVAVFSALIQGRKFISCQYCKGLADVHVTPILGHWNTCAPQPDPGRVFQGLQQPKGPAKPAWGGIKAGAPPPAHQPAETSAPEPSSNEPNILSSVAQDGAANGIAKNQTQKVKGNMPPVLPQAVD